MLLKTIVVVVILSGSSVSASCNQCQFNDNDATDCKVYGQLGDGNLIPWTKASQDCLDIFDIKDEAIDPNTLVGVFPNPDGSNGNANSFINYLRFNSGSVANGIKLSFDIFFQEGNDSLAVLKDTIDVAGISYDCKSSESNCYNAMKTYFGTSPGSSEMQAIGVSLYDQQALSREKEQSLVRIRLCSDNGASTSSCEPLSAQVQEVLAANPSTFCSAFGLGPASYAIPGCNNNNPSTTGSSSTTNPTSGAPWEMPTMVLLGWCIGLVGLQLQ
jgi:hypothetical protein